jgi:hypothetical protein
MCRAQALAGIRSSADSQVELAGSCRSAPTPGCDVHYQPDSGHGVLRPQLEAMGPLEWVADLRTALDFVATTPLASARRIPGQP